MEQTKVEGNTPRKTLKHEKKLQKVAIRSRQKLKAQISTCM